MWVSLPRLTAGSRERIHHASSRDARGLPGDRRREELAQRVRARRGRGRRLQGRAGKQARRHRPAARAGRLRRAGRRRPEAKHRRTGPRARPCAWEPLRLPARICREAGPRDVPRHREDRRHRRRGDRAHRARRAPRPQAGARGARGDRLASDPVVAARVRVVRQDPREEQAARDPARGRPRARGRGRPVEPLAGVDAGRVRRGRRVLGRRLAQVLERRQARGRPPRRGPGGSGRRCWPRRAREGGSRPARTSRSGYSPGR